MEAKLDEMDSAIIRDLLDRIEALREAASKADWTESQRLSQHTLGQGYALLRQVQARRLLLTESSRTMADRHTQLASVLERLARSNQAETFFAAVQNQLTDRDQNELTDAIMLLASGDTQNNPLLDALRDVNRSTVPDIYDLESDFAVAGLTQGLMAGVHATFNQRLASESPPPLSAAEQTQHFEAKLEHYETELRHRQLALYTGLVDKSAGWRHRTSETAHNTAGWVETSLLGFVVEQTNALKVMRNRIEAGQGTAAETIGTLLARAGLLTRLSLATQAASYRLAMEVIRKHPREKAEKVIEQASELAFDLTLPHGRDTTISKLEDSESDQFVEIWGVVKELKVLKLGGNLLVTRITLQATKNEATSVAVARFAHLPHAGLTPGAFVRLSGTYQESAQLNDDQPAVEIQQLSLAELSKTSWLMDFYRLASPWTRPWRTGANIMWSLGEHTGVEDSDEMMGAGELWFTRPVEI